MELTRGGSEPIMLANGETRRMLEDGDALVLRGQPSVPGPYPSASANAAGRCCPPCPLDARVSVESSAHFAHPGRFGPSEKSGHPEPGGIVSVVRRLDPKPPLVSQCLVVVTSRHHTETAGFRLRFSAAAIL